MSQANHVQNISFSTAFLTDKICGVLVNNYAASTYNSILGGSLYRKVIPHNFQRPVFIDALFSTNGSYFVPNGQSPDGTNSFFAYSDSNNIYILSTTNSGNIYYKLICTWIDNFDASNPLVTPLLQTTGKAYFDTRLNYQKVLLQNVATASNPGVGNIGTLPIAHNLGYKPNYKIYFESLPGQVWGQIGNGNAPFLYDFSNQYQAWASITNSQLIVSYQGGSTSPASLRIWYKVYYDQ